LSTGLYGVEVAKLLHSASNISAEKDEAIL
jgi:hypothetical protein